MGRTPTKEAILSRAEELAYEQQLREGLPQITPTEAELKESGLYEIAQRDLMTVYADTESEELKYIHNIASEMGLEVVQKAQVRDLEKRTAKVAKQEAQAKRAQAQAQRRRTRLRQLSWSQRAYRHSVKVLNQPVEKTVKEAVKQVKKALPTIDVRKGKLTKAVKKLPTVDQVVKKLSPTKKKPPKKKAKKLVITKTRPTMPFKGGAPVPTGKVRKPRKRFFDPVRGRMATRPYSRQTTDCNSPWIAKCEGCTHYVRGRCLEASKADKARIEKRLKALKQKPKAKPRPKPKAKPKPKRKTPKKKTTRKPQRSRTMRQLRLVTGVRVFSFPSHVWKTKKPKSKSRKKRRR